jgi:RNA polymerase sigma-70 factor (ECF subfamily)
MDDLVRGLRERRHDALDALLARHGREIQGVAYLILGDRDAAEDVLIETAMAAWDRAGSIRDPSALRAWLLRTATNRSLSSRRHSARVVPLRLVGEGVPPLTVRDHAPDVVGRVALLAGVADLPREMRAAVVLHYYADLSVEDVAAALGKSPNTIKSQLRVALGRLRVALDDGPRMQPAEVRHG